MTAKSGVRHFKRFMRDERGVTALEYGILAAIVAVIIAGVFYDSVSASLNSMFSTVTAKSNIS